MSDVAWSRPSRRSRASNSSTGRRRSTRPSIRPALWSNASSPTSKPGEFCTPTTGDHWARSTQQSPQLSGCSSTRWCKLSLNKPLCSQVSYVNASGEEQNYNPFDWKLQDPNNNIVNATYSGEKDLNSGSLAAGGKVAGNVCFEDPKLKGDY